MVYNPINLNALTPRISALAGRMGRAVEGFGQELGGRVGEASNKVKGYYEQNSPVLRYLANIENSRTNVTDYWLNKVMAIKDSMISPNMRRKSVPSQENPVESSLNNDDFHSVYHVLNVGSVVDMGANRPPAKIVEMISNESGGVFALLEGPDGVGIPGFTEIRDGGMIVTTYEQNKLVQRYREAAGELTGGAVNTSSGDTAAA